MSEELNCPACRKANPVESAEPCGRCGADLNALRAIHAAAAREQSRARQALGEQQWLAAAKHAARYWQLVHSPAAAQLAFLATLAAPDLQTSSRWLARARRS